MPMEQAVALYLAADVMLVTPVRDGMILVAKEFVTTRLDDSGVLVLSEFTGAAAELREALSVSPYDIDGMAATIKRAITTPREEQGSRIRALQVCVAAHDVHRWAEELLAEHRARAGRFGARGSALVRAARGGRRAGPSFAGFAPLARLRRDARARRATPGARGPG
jgi:trehalose 6-phosphate synthase/phosphatase